MTGFARIAARLAVVVLLFVALAGLALAVVFPSRQFRNWLQAEISRRSGYDVRAAALGFQLPLTILADTVEVTKSQQFQFRAGRLSASLNPFDLRSATIHRLKVDQPVLQLDIDEIIKSPTQGAAPVALRYLNVHDGTIVLRKGGRTVFELPRINLDAQNINLDGQSGVTLRADVPQLNGEAELQIKGQLRDMESALSIRSKQSPSSFTRRNDKIAPDEMLHLRVKLRAPEEQKASATVESKFNQLAIGNRKLTGTLEAQLAIDPDFSEADLSGQATLADFPNGLSATPLRLGTGSAAATFTGTFSIANKLLTVNTFQLKSPLGSGVGEGRLTFGAEPIVSAAKLSLRAIPLETFRAYLPAPWSSWSYPGQGQLTVSLRGPWSALDVKGTIQSDSMQVRSDELAVTNISVFAPFEWTGPALRFKDARIRATKLAYTTKGHWQASAEKLQVDAAFDYQTGQPLRLHGRIETAGAKFSSPDNTRVGENLSLGGPFELTTDREKNATILSGQFSADSGELLWGKFFGDLKNQKPVLALEADYLRDHDRLDCRRCDLNLAKLGVVELRGAIERLKDAPLFRLQASSANFSPNGFFEFFLRETFNRQYPVLDKLAIGGEIAFRLQLEGSRDALSAAGEVSLKGGDLRAKSKEWQIGPVALNLPLRIHLGQAKPAASATTPRGKLTIDRIRFANQTIAPIATTVSLSNNALRFDFPIHIRIFGGNIEVGNLFWPDVINQPKQVSFSVEAKLLRLDALTQAMNWPRFSGTLSGSIPEVQSAENLLRTRGEIQAELFGGQVRMGKLEIENPFSPLASIKLDAKLADIQLEQLSKTFAFGHISGILEGSVDGLVLTSGEPSQLRADLHSVDRGGEQRISVEALNKITVLSSGQDAGALYGGLASFFDSFRYSKLGFKATLRNDRLTLRGVESRGDQEYLVVGSFLPPTVNVVSHTQVIAFSELVRRLERINKTDKPTVK